MKRKVSALFIGCALSAAVPVLAQPVGEPEEPEAPPPEEEPSGQAPEGQPQDAAQPPAGTQPAPEDQPAEPASPQLPPPAPPPAPGESVAGDAEVLAPRAADLPPAPAAPPALFPSQLEDDGELPNVGFHGGRAFIRSDDDTFRLYPGGRARVDFAYAPDSPELPAGLGEEFTNPALYVRRVRFELSGEIIQRLFFTMGMELGGQEIGRTPFAGAATPRWVRANAHDGVILPADVSVSYVLRDWLAFTAGSFNVPFSMSNRTREHGTIFLERPLAIRGLAAPNNKDLGLAVWGDVLDEQMLVYEVGVFNGDGLAHPFADERPDVTGRVYARPLATLGDNVFFKKAQIGVSARWGERNQEHVIYDAPSMASAQGFVLWQPGYVDSLDRITHVIPSGSQRAIGGELRLPFSPPTGSVFDIRGEAYYVANNMREAVDGFQETNTERFGRLKGVGWYAMVSFWGCCTDQLVAAEPGVTRPVTVDLGRDEPVKRGINVAFLAGGIHANYAGATREGSTPDDNTPSADIDIYEFGGIVQYWFSWNFRAALQYQLYFTPDSGDPAQNLAVVPKNLVGEDEHLHHELGLRLAVTF